MKSGSKSSRGRRAMGIGAVLMLVSFLALLAFTLVNLSTTRMQMNGQMDTIMQADCLAESAANLAVARIMEDAQFGTPGNAKQTVKMSLPGSQGVGRVTFDAATASQWGMPCSTNNLGGSGSAQGYQRSLPPKTLQIVAEGRVGNTVRRVEAVVAKPPYKYALACSGTIYSSGGLLIEGIKDLSALSQGVNAIPPDLVKPGYVACNTGDPQGLQLLSSAALPTLITGDAQSCGGIVLGGSTTVKGAVKEKSDAILLPQIKVTDYDPQGMGALTDVPQGQYNTPLMATGVLRRSGDLAALQGITLDGGYLYVDGNLQVVGGLKGKGALFVTGSLSIQGSSNFSADGIQAILARGNVSLGGNSKDTSFFNGLVYTEGNFQASDITLVGAVIANRVGGSQMNMQRTNVLHNPAAVSFSFQFPAIKPKNLMSTAIGGGFGGENYYADVVRDPNLDFSTFFDAKTDSFSANGLDLKKAGIQFVLQRSTDGKVWKLDTPQGVADTLQSINAQTQMPLATITSTMQTVAQIRLDELKQQLQDLNGLYQKTKMESLKKGSFSLDPNQFLQVGDQLRKVMWRHLP